MDKPLPPNWEQKIDEASGRPYYLNHETKTSSWEDPRLAGGSAPPPTFVPQNAQPGAAVPMNYANPVQPGAPIQMQPVTQQPGQIVMVPNPAEVQGCPPGLEHLLYLDNLYVKQKVEMLEVFTGFSTENKYMILNPAMQQIFYGKEDSGCCERMWCGSIRPFILKISDNSGREVLHLDRPFAYNTPYAPCFFPLNFCLLQKMTVLSPLTGEVLGHIKQNWELCAPTLNLEDVNGNLIGIMRAPFCVFNCGNDIDFPIEKDNQELALVAHKWGGFVREVYTNADDYHVKFPLTMPPQHKAVVLAACILVDYMFFENKQNNRH